MPILNLNPLPGEEQGSFEVALTVVDKYNSLAVNALIEEYGCNSKRCLLGEVEHSIGRKASLSETHGRHMSVDMEKVSHSLKNFRIESDESDKDVKLLLATIKPAGPYGDKVKENLESGAILFARRSLKFHGTDGAFVRCLKMVAFDLLPVDDYMDYPAEERITVTHSKKLRKENKPILVNSK